MTESRDKAIEYLSQTRRMKARLASLSARICEAREAAELVRSASVERSRAKGASHDAPFVSAISEIEDYERELADRASELIAVEREVARAIEAVDDVDLRLVLECRYLRSMSWPAIAAELYCDESTVRRWHGRALDALRIP